MSTEYAVTFTGREKAELLPVEPDTRPLGDGEVVGPTLASVISPGTELASGYTGERFPVRSGYAAVFEVAAVGAAVKGIAVGDRCLTMGNHRSRQRAPAREAVPVPRGLAPEAAAFARLMGVSMSTLATTRARPPAAILVTGLGIVGHLAAKIFEACGYAVTAVDPHPARRELAQSLGLARVLPAVPPESAGPFDLVVECSGHEEAVIDACKVVRTGGEVVLVGVPWKQRSQAPAFAITHAVFHRYVTLRSGWEWELPHQPTDFRPGSIYGSFAGALRWLHEGRVRVEGLAEIVSPRDCQRAYQGLLKQTPPTLTNVFDWRTLDQPC